MVDLRTNYLNLLLKNPIIPSASPLSQNLDTAKRLEDAGAPALVTHSLFEEKFQGLGTAKKGLPEEGSRYEDEYLECFSKLNSHLDIPLIASINGTSAGRWLEYGKALEEAGAKAIELNVYYLAADGEASCQHVEDHYVDVLMKLRRHVVIPISMKVSSQFSSFLNFARRLDNAGIQGLTMFNRFYQPDIDLESLEVKPKLEYSTSSDSLVPIRWTAILSGRISCALGVSGGIHTSEDVLKAILAGADITYMCSALLRDGPELLAKVIQEVGQWLERHDYRSIQQIRGSASHRFTVNPTSYERMNYIHVLESYGR